MPIPAELIPIPKYLVVDDEPAISTWVVDEIKERIPNCQVMAANDGFSAGELVGTMKPDVVILDLRMPELDGFEVCRRIKSKETTKDIVVIAMTSMRSPKVEKRVSSAAPSSASKNPSIPPC